MAKGELSLFISLAAMIPKVFAESGIVKILASYMAAKQGGVNSFSLDVGFPCQRIEKRLLSSKDCIYIRSLIGV